MEEVYFEYYIEIAAVKSVNLEKREFYMVIHHYRSFNENLLVARQLAYEKYETLINLLTARNYRESFLSGENTFKFQVIIKAYNTFPPNSEIDAIHKLSVDVDFLNDVTESERPSDLTFERSEEEMAEMNQLIANHGLFLEWELGNIISTTPVYKTYKNEGRMLRLGNNEFLKLSALQKSKTYSTKSVTSKNKTVFEILNPAWMINRV